MTAHIRKIDGKLVLALDDAMVSRLSLSEGDAFEMDVRDEVIVLLRADADADDRGRRLAHGRAFIDRYQETFKALAK